MERDEAHAARAVAREAVDRHFAHDVAAVFDVRGLAVGRVRARYVVVDVYKRQAQHPHAAGGGEGRRRVQQEIS